MAEPEAALADHDFLDFGASKGGVIDFAAKRLGGRRGLGVDLDPRKVAEMRARGYDCIEGDITRLRLPAGCVRFVTMSHVLEHLTSVEEVRRALACAAHVARDFLFIQGPFFEADAWLRRRGLKFFWSDWSGHRCHVTLAMIEEALVGIGVQEIRSGARVPVVDSSDASLHPLASPRDQHEYAPALHPAKPHFSFPWPLYREIVCVVRLREFPEWTKVAVARPGVVPAAEFAHRFSASE